MYFSSFSSRQSFFFLPRPPFSDFSFHRVFPIIPRTQNTRGFLIKDYPTRFFPRVQSATCFVLVHVYVYVRECVYS